jgi:hypothetical protein
MSRTMKYFLTYLGKTVGAIIGVGVYTFSVGYVLTDILGFSRDLSAFLMFGVPLCIFGVYMMWDIAKAKVNFENQELIRKIKD